MSTDLDAALSADKDEAIVKLIRGEFLRDDCYDDWIVPMREELRSKLAAALRPRLHELGDQAPEGHDEPVALARRLVGIGEWNPVSHQLLIGALLAAGDPTGARGVQERLDDLGWDSG